MARTLARDFSAALDEMFKLNGIGALEQAVEEKYDISILRSVVN